MHLLAEELLSSPLERKQFIETDQLKSYFKSTDQLGVNSIKYSTIVGSQIEDLQLKDVLWYRPLTCRMAKINEKSIGLLHRDQE